MEACPSRCTVHTTTTFTCGLANPSPLRSFPPLLLPTHRHTRTNSRAPAHPPKYLDAGSSEGKGGGEDPHLVLGVSISLGGEEPLHRLRVAGFHRDVKGRPPVLKGLREDRWGRVTDTGRGGRVSNVAKRRRASAVGNEGVQAYLCVSLGLTLAMTGLPSKGDGTSKGIPGRKDAQDALAARRMGGWWRWWGLVSGSCACTGGGFGGLRRLEQQPPAAGGAHARFVAGRAPRYASLSALALSRRSYPICGCPLPHTSLLDLCGWRPSAA